MLVNNDPNKYERIYLPKMLSIPKRELEHYTFIKTIPAGSGIAHILRGGNDFFLCIRSKKDDFIRVEERLMEPLGFRRSSIEALEEIAARFDKVYNDDLRSYKGYNGASRKWDNAVKIPSTIMWDEPWHIRMRGYFIINTITGEEVSLGLSKAEISSRTRLTSHLINVIVKNGVEAGVHGMWAFKGERLDGLTWEQFFNKDIPKPPVERKMKHPIIHYKVREALRGITFVKENITIKFSTLRQTSQDVGISHETLRKLLMAKADTVKGFKIVYPS